MDSAEPGKRLHCFYEFCVFVHHSGLPHPILCGYAGMGNCGRIRNIAGDLFMKTGIKILVFSFFYIKYSCFCIVSRSFLLYNYHSPKRGKGEMERKGETMMQKHPLYERFLQERVVAILRGLAPENAVACGKALSRAGIKLLEVPLNRPGALESIRLLAEHFRGSGLHVGAGTVLAAEEVELVREAGGEFILSPNARSSVIRRTKELGLLSMPGFATPGEAFDAVDAGADLLKVFPCGSPENVSVLKSVIPLPVFAVGGIEKKNKREYLKTADGVGVGIGIFRPELSPEELYFAAKEFLEA